MTAETLPEVWLRGPLPGIPDEYQPAAHALLQAKEEIHELLTGFNTSKLWEKPGGVASIAFHLQHITGVLDRLMTYAMNESLNDIQLAYLAAEGKFNESISLEEMIVRLDNKVNETIERLKNLPAAKAFEKRFVGRKKLPSTVSGLIFHAAEHTMRHTGQLHVTIRILNM